MTENPKDHEIIRESLSPEMIKQMGLKNMRDKNSETLPHIIESKEIYISSENEQFSDLVNLFPNFKKFSIYIHYLENAREGGLHIDGNIFIGKYKNEEEKNSIIRNEIMHAILFYHYPSLFSTDKEEEVIKRKLPQSILDVLGINYDRLDFMHLDEWFSDLASLTSNSKETFERLKNTFTPENINAFEEERINSSANIKELREKIEELKEKEKKGEDVKINLRLREFQLKTYIESYKKMRPNIYMLSSLFFDKIIKEEPQIDQMGMAQAFIKKAKFIIPLLDVYEKQMREQGEIST